MSAPTCPTMAQQVAADEASRIAADIAYNADKDVGGPARRNQERAMALQMKQPQTNEGFFV